MGPKALDTSMRGQWVPAPAPPPKKVTDQLSWHRKVSYSTPSVVFNLYFEYGRIDKLQITTDFKQTTLNKNFARVHSIQTNSAVC